MSTAIAIDSSNAASTSNHAAPASMSTRLTASSPAALSPDHWRAERGAALDPWPAFRSVVSVMSVVFYLYP
jgi:hypothetical protein